MGEVETDCHLATRLSVGNESMCNGDHLHSRDPMKALM
jgi:hypothetical protein